MKKKLFLMAAALGVCACTFWGCRAKPLFDAGDELTAEELAALRASMQEKSEEQKPAAHQIVNAGAAEGEQTFYFVGEGVVYHSARDCTYLKKSGDVREGNAAAVAAAGKTRLCSSCAQGERGEVLPEQGNEQDAQEVCYYTSGGDTWHFDRWCGSLKNSKNVIAGTVGEALGAGKSRPCAHCGD